MRNSLWNFIKNSYDKVDIAIIEAAKVEFARNGFYRANVDNIAKMANVGKGTVYRRFVDKSKLFISTIIYYREMFLKNIEDICNTRIKDKSEFIDMLKRLFKEYIKAGIEQKDLILLIIHQQSEIVIHPQEKQKIMQGVRRHMLKHTEILKKMFERAKKRGIIKDIGSENLAFYTIGIFNSIVMYKHIMLDIDISEEDEIRFAIKLFEKIIN